MVDTKESSNANGVAPGHRPGNGHESKLDADLESRRTGESAAPSTGRQPSPAAARAASPVAAKRKRQRKPKITCADCYFQRNMLCALDAAEPCPTFRHHEQGLKPPRQLAFVFRQERTRAAWVFEQRHD